MKLTDVTAVNKLDLYQTGAQGSEITVYWLMASHGDNSHTLNYRTHRHTFFEIHFVLFGHMMYAINDKQMKISGGEFAVIAPSTPHRVVSHSDDFLKVTLAVDVRGSIYDSLDCLSDKAFKIDSALVSILDAVTEYANSSIAYAENIVKYRLTEAVYLIADKGMHRQIFRGNTDYRVFKAKKYIEDNPDVFLNCAEVASYCNLSPKQLGRLFEKHEGKSVLSYIHEVKTNIASTLIADTDEPIESIAKKLGFSDVSYFYKFFFRMTGLTPGEYRQKEKKVKEV